MLETCGIKLHKWNSNSKELLNSSSDQEHSFSTNTESAMKTLGISWKPTGDYFMFKVSTPSIASYTKRDVLSVIARLYGPLGLIGPVISKAKIFVQKLWLRKLNWEEFLPDAIAPEWINFVSSLKALEELKIDRYILTYSYVKLMLLGYADASEFLHNVKNTSRHSGPLTNEELQKAKLHLIKRIQVTVFNKEIEILRNGGTIKKGKYGILNSHPLTPMSSDPNDFAVLTPGHFLISRPLQSLPEPHTHTHTDMTDKLDNCLSQWQKLTKFVLFIWRKWRLDYLNNLQARHKWQFEKENVTPNSMVILKDENLPCKWTMGRILEIVKGSDGKVRVVKVETPQGEAHELHPPSRTQPGIVVHVCEDQITEGRRMKIVQTRRPDSMDSSSSSSPPSSPTS
ncbi:reverse transcriptase domain-containing protein [Trichonephila clavipes]|nr:reverse transcriptase domain-containing protein [Trichonephila clavipes]